MGLNINNTNNRFSIIRMNGAYCAFIFFMLYIICLNNFVYKDYYYAKDPCGRKGLKNVSPIDISDYHWYGPSWRRCALYFLHSFGSAADVFINLIMYIIAYVRLQRRPLTLKHFLMTDIFLWLLFCFIFIVNLIDSPRDHVLPVPALILHPIALVFMILFRFRQYKKYGIIKNGINLSKIKEVLSIKQQKFLNFASRFRHAK